MSRLADASFDGRVRQSVSKGAVLGWVVVSIALDDVCVSHKYILQNFQSSQGGSKAIKDVRAYRAASRQPLRAARVAPRAAAAVAVVAARGWRGWKWWRCSSGRGGGGIEAEVPWDAEERVRTGRERGCLPPPTSPPPPSPSPPRTAVCFTLGVWMEP